MRFRSILKRIYYASMFPRQNKFRYFGTLVFFPKNSLVFRLACEAGIYETAVLKVINRLIRPGTTYMDVGANIGLMSVAVLASREDCQVISIEASPTAAQ